MVVYGVGLVGGFVCVGGLPIFLVGLVEFGARGFCVMCYSFAGCFGGVRLRVLGMLVWWSWVTDLVCSGWFSFVVACGALGF